MADSPSLPSTPPPRVTSSAKVPSPSVRNLLLYCWALLAMGTAIGAWSIATPLMAAPDEPAHAINAAAVVRGEVDVAEHPTMVGPVGVVRVPAWVASTNSLAGTFIWFPTSSAAFAPHVSSSTETVD